VAKNTGAIETGDCDVSTGSKSASRIVHCSDGYGVRNDEYALGTFPDRQQLSHRTKSALA
jgi:hypothetical protein